MWLKPLYIIANVKRSIIMMRSSNPTLVSNPFASFRTAVVSQVMTIQGTIQKTALLLILVLLPAIWVDNMAKQGLQGMTTAQTWMTIGLFGGLIASLVTIFKKEWAPFSAPLYAVLEGLFLGGISASFQQAYPGIVFQAVMLSISTLMTMLIIYQMGWIKVSESFKMGLFAATGGIALTYLLSMVLSFFGVSISFITGNSMFSILFSVFVVVIAALNFILDFEFIKQGAALRVPKYMEWYGAFALMVTLIWLYMEILRLLSKMTSRR